jgi:hypothetical protein
MYFSYITCILFTPRVWCLDQIHIVTTRAYDKDFRADMMKEGFLGEICGGGFLGGFLGETCGGRVSPRSASERRGYNSKGFKDFYLKGRARLWP